MGDLSKAATPLKTAASMGHNAAVYLMKILYVRLRQILQVPVAQLPHDIYNPDVSNWSNDNQLKPCRDKLRHVLEKVQVIRWKSSDTRDYDDKRPCTNRQCGRWNNPWEADFMISCNDECLWINEHNHFYREFMNFVQAIYYYCFS